MKAKLKLDLDELCVESFMVTENTRERGTVEARGPATEPGLCPATGDYYCSFGRRCTYPEYTCGGPGCDPGTIYVTCPNGGPATCDLSCQIC
jgi:hypothetical protein